MVRSLHPSVEALEGRRLLARFALAYPGLPLSRAERVAAHSTHSPAHPVRLPHPPLIVRPAPAAPSGPAHAAAKPHWNPWNIPAAVIGVPIMAVAGLFHKGI
jgi:hypothetical protein